LRVTCVSAAVTLVSALRQTTSRQRICFPPHTLTAKRLISRLSGGVTSLAGHDPVTASSALVLDFLLRMPNRRPLSPWRLPCGTRQSVTVPFSADLPCGSPVYWRPLPWCSPCGRRPVGNGSALHQSSFRTTRLPQTVRSRDIPCGTSAGHCSGWLSRELPSQTIRSSAPVTLAYPLRDLSQSVTGPLSAGLPCGSPAYRRPSPWRSPFGVSTSRQRFLLSTTHPYGQVAHQQTVRWCRIPCGKRPSLPARLPSRTSFSGCPWVGLSTLACPLRNPSVGHCPTFRRSPLRVTHLLAAVALAYTFRRVGQSVTDLLSTPHPCRQGAHQQSGFSSRTSFSGSPCVSLSHLGVFLAEP